MTDIYRSLQHLAYFSTTHLNINYFPNFAWLLIKTPNFTVIPCFPGNADNPVLRSWYNGIVISSFRKKNKTHSLNSFYASGLFLYPLKTENQKFSDVFRRYRKETSSMVWSNQSKSSVIIPLYRWKLSGLYLQSFTWHFTLCE